MAKTYQQLLAIMKKQQSRTDLPQDLKDCIVDVLSCIIGYDGNDMMSPDGIQDYLYAYESGDDLTLAAAARFVYTLI